jgi:hypothetical protein
VFAPPREVLGAAVAGGVTEMPRNSERSFCCGAGGARMWMEENTGERINVNRTKEAVATGADQIAVGCPFCRVMLSDGLTAQQAAGEAREEVEVLDIAQMLLASVKGEGKQAARKTDAAPAANKAAGAAVAEDEETKAEPDAGDTTQTDETVTDTEDVGPAAKASGGSSLFDMGEESTDDGSADDQAEEAPAPEAKPAAGTESSGGSLFDLGGDEEPETKPAAKAAEAEEPAASAESEPAAGGTSATPGTKVPEGGSLFDLEAPTEEPAPAASDEATPADHDAAADSTTDADTDRSKDAADTDVAPEDGAEDDAQDDATESEDVADAAAQGPTPDSDGSESSDAPLTSLRDIKAKYAEGAATSTGSETAAPDADEETETPDTPEAREATEAQETPEADAVPEPHDEPSDAVTDEPSAGESDAEDEPAEEETAEESGAPVQNKAKPATSGDSHSPRTDAEIGEGGSLFDL